MLLVFGLSWRRAERSSSMAFSFKELVLVWGYPLWWKRFWRVLWLLLHQSERNRSFLLSKIVHKGCCGLVWVDGMIGKADMRCNQ